MILTFGDLLRLARFTVTNPRQGARAVLDIDPPMQARWLALALAAVGAALVASVEFAVLPEEVRRLIGPDLPSPLLSAVLQGGLLVLVSWLIHRVGRWRGGRGSFADALLLVAWTQMLLLGMELVQLVAHLILPPLSDVIGVLGIVLFFWLLSHFVAELHGFGSVVAVLGGIVVVMLIAAFVMASLLMPLLQG